MSSPRLLHYIDERWPNIAAGELAKVIAERVLSMPLQETECLRYSDFLRMSGLQKLTPELHSAIAILTAGREPLLRAFAIFVDENENEHVIRGEEFRTLVTENLLVHPASGELVPEPAKHVAPVFEMIKNKE